MSLIARCKRPKCFCPAEVPQVPREMLWRLRVLPQVSRDMLWRLRVLPQVSREMLWCLRESRKSRGKCLGVYGNPASLAGNALVFAGVPQVSREMLWRLREFRKSKKERFGICRTSAGHFQKRSSYGVASIETLCWLYSFVELTAKKGAPHFHGDTPLKIDRLRLRYFR